MPAPTNTNYPALPVKVRHKSWRQMVVAADPEFVQDSENPPEYEMPSRNNTKRVFRGYYKNRGAYES